MDKYFIMWDLNRSKDFESSTLLRETETGYDIKKTENSLHRCLWTCTPPYNTYQKTETNLYEHLRNSALLCQTEVIKKLRKPKGIHISAYIQVLYYVRLKLIKRLRELKGLYVSASIPVLYYLRPIVVKRLRKLKAF